ncbi:MAG TPA: hypothetical protein VGU01_02435 [Sphingomicrobium sp.]|nr:hypothetical protein [Sphingomicrobium sp.]
MRKAARAAQQLQELEEEYRSILTRALTDCAAGRWGLFGQNHHTGFSRPLSELDELRALARRIDQLHEQLGEGPYELHQQFEAARGRAGPNELGEPKQAAAWLRRLAER